MPKTRVSYWQEKFASNVTRDRRAANELERLGWRVMTIWECETKQEELLTKLLQCIRNPAGGSDAA
jgi:DNA mismatch endonuclease (patch repair protein)